MRPPFKSLVVSLAIFTIVAFPALTQAGFSETLPKGTFLLEESFAISRIDSIWNDSGNSQPLIEAVERYEPGGGKQGVINANPSANYYVLINKLQYGITDELSIGIGIPVVVRTKVVPGLSWESGDYQNQLGREYSEQDFWDWADSMGQQRPGTWIGNKGVLSDIVIAARYRFSDHLPSFKKHGFSAALTIGGILPTGKNADPEEIMSVGTTLWDLHTQGDLTFHLGLEKSFKEKLDGRLRIGLDLFYEVFFTRELDAPTGEKHPLLLNYQPYVGDSYRVKPGDFSGFAFEIEVVPYKGPAKGTWLTDGSAEKAASLPPILSLSVRYTFVHLQQSNWTSDFPLWDWEREKLWLPGYKNILEASLNVSLLRLGVPAQIFASARTLNLIPGKNCRAAELISVGLRIPMKFW